MSPVVWKRVLILGSTAIVLGAGWFVANLKSDNSPAISISSGRTFRYLGVTFGKTHSWNFNRGWRRLVPSILPQAIQQRLGIRGRQVITLKENACVVWADDLHPVGNWMIVPCEITDGAGNKYYTDSLGPPYIFRGYPRRDTRFRVRFGYNLATGFQNLFEAEVENRGQRDYPTWQPEVLPAIKTNHDVAVRLNGFQPDNMRIVRPDAEVSLNGQPVMPEQYTMKWTYVDATGNHPPSDLKEAAWKLKLRLTDKRGVPLGNRETTGLTNLIPNYPFEFYVKPPAHIAGLMEREDYP